MIAELKRRNVLRAAAAYIVVSWLLIQVTETIFPLFGYSDAPARFLVIFMGICFTPVMIFAWVFEWTPQGFRKDKDIDPAQSIAPYTGKKLDRIIMAMLAIALGYFAFDKFILQPQRNAAQQEQQVAELVEAKEEGRSEALVASFGDHSIAVLPFIDMSIGKDQEYMSDGIAEELLNLLTKIPELRVISRSSAFAFKGEKIDIPEVGKQLNVAHVLEGSVRKAGNQIRITTQLIHARSDTHVWSETYDRTLENIFAIQDEIAGKVVEQLKIQLLSDAPQTTRVDPAAYAMFLQGHHLRLERTPESLEQAKELFEQALELDSSFVAAWVELAGLYATQANDGLIPIKNGYSISKGLIDKALALDPEYATAWSTRGYISNVYDGDVKASAEYQSHALRLEPGNTNTLRRAAALLTTLGRIDEAITLLEFAMARDPLRLSGHSSLSLYYGFAGRVDDAIASLRTALLLDPNYGNARYQMAMALLAKGQQEDALLTIEEQKSTWRMVGLAMIYHDMGQTEKADSLLNELIEEHQQGWAYNIATIFAYRDESDKAFEWLDKAVEYKDGGLTEVHNEPLFSNIHNDPRWITFLESHGKSPEQLAAIEFNVMLPD